MLQEARRRRLIARIQDIFIYELVYSLVFEGRLESRWRFLQPRPRIAYRDARSFLRGE
jgi:hypothetical protein